MPIIGPAHGAPLSSQWARDITAYVNAFNRWSGTPAGGTTVGTNVRTANSMVVPAPGFAGHLHVTGTLELTGGTNNDQFYVSIYDGTTEHTKPIVPIGAALLTSCSVTAQIPFTAVASKTISLRVQRFFGSGTITVSASTVNNRLDAIFIPD